MPSVQEEFMISSLSLFQELSSKHKHSFINRNLFVFLWLENTTVNISHRKEAVLSKGFMKHQSYVQTSDTVRMSWVWCEELTAGCSPSHVHRPISTTDPSRSFPVFYQHPTHLKHMQCMKMLISKGNMIPQWPLEIRMQSWNMTTLSEIPTWSWCLPLACVGVSSQRAKQKYWED